jgi:outer membrane receptor protein involved in Fe transport
MKQLYKLGLRALLFLFTITSLLWSGTTGKIAGILTDKTTGEPLFGATIVVVGTTLGAASDADGQYTILEVPPGTYNLQVSFIGYRKIIVDGIRVNIDQTARVDVQLESQAIEIGETVVLAQRSIIKKDVATSVVAITDKEVKELPITSVVSAIGLQAGVSGGWGGNPNWANQPDNVKNYNRYSVSVQGGISIRGGGGDNILFMLDGVTMRDPRNNEPLTSVPISAVKEVSVERGGFNAEYGQVRSGIINVITREGDKTGYYGSFQMRMSPAARKYVLVDGNYDVSDPRSYVLRPFFDDAVCWEGTGKWDTYTRKQYPEFMGWNEISRILCTDNNPNNDLTPAGAQKVFMYETRKKMYTDKPDYNIDAGFGGPIPYVSKMLGDLRFFVSFISSHDVLMIPLARSAYDDYNLNAQITSDISPSMKLRISGLYGKQYSMRSNWDNEGGYSYIHYPSEIAGAASAVTATSDLLGLFSDFNFSLSDVDVKTLSAKLTHTISSKTFYEVSVEMFGRDYFTRPIATRDTSGKTQVIPGFYEDSNPFGYWPGTVNGVAITSAMHASRPRDNTKVSSATIKADFTSQVNFQNLVKAGIEFNYNDLNFDYGIQTTSKVIASGQSGQDEYDSRVQMRVFPFRGSAYVQDKLEANGFTVNAGLRLDYFNANSEWWNLNPYDAAFFSSKYNSTSTYDVEKTKGQWQLSPRLGISHPITENAKLFFNYGHFKQVPQYETLFRVNRTSDKQMSDYGNPNLVQAKTISYELGFDYLFFEDVLLQVAAFYNDVSDQQDVTTFYSTAAGFSYRMTSANNYQDTRGFEITLRKTAGRWWSGFINYTYQVNTTGHFGSSRLYDNPSDQKNWNEATINLYQDRPIPQPNARANINLYTPNDFGPIFMNHNILGGWGLNIVLNWNAGYWTTWNPKNVPSIAYNVESLDYFNATLRLQKTVEVGAFNIQLFMDISNLFNTYRLWNTNDQDYMLSLHLPQSEAYDNIPGEDKVGDYRKPGATYTPMEYTKKISSGQTGNAGAIYYEGSSGKYFEYVNSNWVQVDQSRIDKINDDKSYVDMPNASTFWFLDPRDVYFGVRVSFNL